MECNTISIFNHLYVHQVGGKYTYKKKKIKDFETGTYFLDKTRIFQLIFFIEVSPAIPPCLDVQRCFTKEQAIVADIFSQENATTFPEKI